MSYVTDREGLTSRLDIRKPLVILFPNEFPQKINTNEIIKTTSEYMEILFILSSHESPAPEEPTCVGRKSGENILYPRKIKLITARIIQIKEKLMTAKKNKESKRARLIITFINRLTLTIS